MDAARSSWLFFCHELGMTDSFLAGSYIVTRPSLHKIACGESLQKGTDMYLRELVRALADRRRMLLMRKQGTKAEEVRGMIVRVLFLEFDVD